MVSVDRGPDLARERDVDWVAVLLELIPLVSVLLVVWFFLNGGTGRFGLTLLPLLVTGAGWWKIGRGGIGCALALVRGIVLAATIVISILMIVFALGCAFGDEVDSGCADDATRAWIGFLVSLAFFCAVAYLVPIASAIMVAFASRDREYDHD